jgi:hypothetical protein
LAVGEWQTVALSQQINFIRTVSIAIGNDSKERTISIAIGLTLHQSPPDSQLIALQPIGLNDQQGKFRIQKLGVKSTSIIQFRITCQIASPNMLTKYHKRI